MAAPGVSDIHRRFAVVVHDVAPAFLPQLARIAEALAPAGRAPGRADRPAPADGGDGASPMRGGRRVDPTGSTRHR